MRIQAAVLNVRHRQRLTFGTHPTVRGFAIKQQKPTVGLLFVRERIFRCTQTRNVVWDHAQQKE